jgi:tRNA(Ile)-lysidine synthase
MLLPLESQLAQAWPPADWAGVTVVVAVSGGGDSVALLRALVALKTDGGGRIVAAHLNHQLRPEADADEQFVVELCQKLGVPCEVERIAIEPLAVASGDGIEAAARSARYAFLKRAAERHGARFVATAHTADDQAETILHRIIRGTGVRGLSGMRRTRLLGHAVLIRPLLDLRGEELRDYLDALQQPYRHDASNSNVRFTRNRLRHEVLPRLQKQFNVDVAGALLRLGALAGEAQAVIDALVDAQYEQCVTVENSGAVRIDLHRLLEQPRYVVRELLMTTWQRQSWPMQAMGSVQWNELCELAVATQSPMRKTFPGGISAEIAVGQLRLSL